MKEPKLRFPEFIGNWKQYKISEVGNIVTGSTPKTSISENYGGDFLFVSPADIQGNRYIDKTITTLTKKGFDQGRKIREKASLFVSIGSTIGKVAQARQELTTNQQINAVEPYNNFDDDFIFTSLENVAANIKAIASNQAVPIVNKTTFGNVEIRVPSELVEQQKIGSLFAELDTLIQSAEKELEGYRELKQGMLQKMFPKKGETVPEIRFPEFDGSWELCKISELCSVATGKSNTQDKVEDGKYPFYVRSPIVERSTKYLYDEEAVITVGDGVGTGKVFHYVNGKYDLHQRCYRMYGFSDKLNAHYFYYVFSKLFYKRVKSMTAKTSVDSVRMEMIADMKIPVPTIEEQIKIGTYFDNLDNLIALQQKEIDGYKELKKGLLQQMFC